MRAASSDHSLQGFDGKVFSFSAAGGTWRQLLGSSGQGLSLRAQYGASVANNATVQRGIEFKSGRKTVLVQISGARFALSITANGTQFTGAGTALLGGGVTMQVTNFSPPAMGVLRRVTVHAGFASLVISQRWDDKLNTAGDALNFGLTLTGPLKPTVSGLLGPSYTAALHEQTRAAGVAAAAAVRLTATGGH